MQTLRISKTIEPANIRVVEAKKKFIQKIKQAQQAEGNILKAIQMITPRKVPDLNEKSNLLDRFLKGMDEQYQTKANIFALQNLLAQAEKDLATTQTTKKITNISKEYITIQYRNGVIQPKNGAPTSDCQWQIQTSFQAWSAIGSPGQKSIFPNISSGKVRLTCRDVKSNVINIETVIKRQVSSEKRQPYKFSNKDPEFIARCHGVAGRILRLCNPRISARTGFNYDGARFSARVFEDRVSRLPVHLGISSQGIIKLCRWEMTTAFDRKDELFIKMVEFCEPTIHLNPDARRRKIKQIQSGETIELRLNGRAASPVVDDEEIGEEKVEETTDEEFAQSSGGEEESGGEEDDDYEGPSKKELWDIIDKEGFENITKTGLGRTNAAIWKDIQQARQNAITEAARKAEEERQQAKDAAKIAEEADQKAEAERQQAIIAESEAREAEEARIAAREAEAQAVLLAQQAEAAQKAEAERLAKEAEEAVKKAEEAARQAAQKAEEEAKEARKAEEDRQETLKRAAKEAAEARAAKEAAEAIQAEEAARIAAEEKRKEFNEIEEKAFKERQEQQAFKERQAAAKRAKERRAAADKNTPLPPPVSQAAQELKRRKEAAAVLKAKAVAKNAKADAQKAAKEAAEAEAVSKLKEDDRQRINDKFEQFDLDGDGNIDLAELREAYTEDQQLGGRALQVFDTYDENANNLVDLDEFTRWCAMTDATSVWRQEEDAYGEMSKLMFEGMDLNENDELTYQEVRKYLSVHPNIKQSVFSVGQNIGRWNDLFLKLDPNQDSIITREELASFLQDNVLLPADTEALFDEIRADSRYKKTMTKRKYATLQKSISGLKEAKYLVKNNPSKADILLALRKRNIANKFGSAAAAGSADEEKEFESEDELDLAIAALDVPQPSGELTSMVANMSDDWAESDEELNFAEDSDSGSVKSMEFAESSAIEQTADDSGGLEFAESSAIEATDESDAEQVQKASDSSNLSGMDFAESSAVESESDKVSSEAAFAESSDYD